MLRSSGARTNGIQTGNRIRRIGIPRSPNREVPGRRGAQHTGRRPASRARAQGDVAARSLRRLVARGRYKVMFGYGLNYPIDMENAVILDVEATPARYLRGMPRR